MNDEPRPSVGQKMPTLEQLAARQLRLLRQARGWSQQEVAEKLRAYGYDWSQATVTRLESASRPIRLNELADLAALYGVKVTQFFEPYVPEDQEALAVEIEVVTEEHERLKGRLAQATAAYDEAATTQAKLAAHMAHVEGRLRTLLQWQQGSAEGGGRQ
jgi:transcriptional regulator with XRE-family HTH domain